MATLTERLEALEEQIWEIQQEKERIIKEEPLAFDHLELPFYAFGRDRYLIVLADGSQNNELGKMRYAQRPAAERAAGMGRGRFILDMRTGMIRDGEGTVLAEVELAKPTEMWGHGTGTVKFLTPAAVNRQTEVAS